MTAAELRLLASALPDGDPIRKFLETLTEDGPITRGTMRELKFRSMSGDLYSRLGINVLFNDGYVFVKIGVVTLREVNTAGRLAALLFAVRR